MRLVLVMQNRQRAEALRQALYARWEAWQVTLASGAEEGSACLLQGGADLAVLVGSPAEHGASLLLQLMAQRIPCPPRVLYLCETGERPALIADCFAPITASDEQLCRLLSILAKKPLPSLAVQDVQRLSLLIDSFLDELSMPKALKGRGYTVWLLHQITPSPLRERRPLGELYTACAKVHGTTPAAVERCLRVAVESVFTQGSIQGIERCFGATVDPEKGKPTNRAFLLRAAQLLRCRMEDHSFTETRSLNNSEMHQRPAAPTSV